MQPTPALNKDNPIRYDVECLREAEGKGSFSLWARPGSLLHNICHPNSPNINNFSVSTLSLALILPSLLLFSFLFPFLLPFLYSLSLHLSFPHFIPVSLSIYSLPLILLSFLFLYPVCSLSLKTSHSLFFCITTVQLSNIKILPIVPVSFYGNRKISIKPFIQWSPYIQLSLFGWKQYLSLLGFHDIDLFQKCRSDILQCPFIWTCLILTFSYSSYALLAGMLQKECCICPVASYLRLGDDVDMAGPLLVMLTLLTCFKRYLYGFSTAGLLFSLCNE